MNTLALGWDVHKKFSMVSVQEMTDEGQIRVVERARFHEDRMAETLDKFEEDVLGSKTATIRGSRAATVTFGEPILVESGRGKKTAAKTLTRTIEERVQGLLDGECDSTSATSSSP